MLYDLLARCGIEFGADMVECDRKSSNDLVIRHQGHTFSVIAENVQLPGIHRDQPVVVFANKCNMTVKPLVTIVTGQDFMTEGHFPVMTYDSVVTGHDLKA